MSKPKISKNEEVEFNALLDKCNQIMKEDRNILRATLKDASNDELIALLRKHKKKLDLSSLQIDLRKIINKLKGKTPSQTSLPHPSQQQLEKKPQSSKTNLRLPEKSPEQKNTQAPPIPKKEERKGNESPSKRVEQAKKIEKTVEKAKKMEPQENKRIEKKEPTANEKIALLAEKTTKTDKPGTANEKAEKQEKVEKIEMNDRIVEKNSTAEKIAKLNDKPIERKVTPEPTPKQKPLKKMDQIDEVVRESNEKYDTPSFKAHQQATFRPSLLDKKKEILPQGLLINPNIDANNFIALNKEELEREANRLLQVSSPNGFQQEGGLLFHESDTYNLADLSLPQSLPQVQNSENQSKNEEKNIKSGLPEKNFPEIQLSPKKSEKLNLSYGAENQNLRPSVRKTVKFITEKPRINPKIVSELQRTLGIADLPPENVFDRLIGEVHLSRTSRTYFKYKVENLAADKEPKVNPSVVDRFFEICDLKQDGFIDLNELGFALENLCLGTLKKNSIKQIYMTFDPENVGFIREDDFVNVLINLHEKFGEVADENAFRSYFAHLDEDQKGILTYWDFYFMKNNGLVADLKEICGIQDD